MVQLSKDELQQQYSQQSHQVSELQARLTNASVETEALKRKLEELTQVSSYMHNEKNLNTRKTRLMEVVFLLCF